jgi:uncharacterized membrane protein
MLYAICKVLFVFLLYSFVGYVTEILTCLIDDKYLTFQRGYLLGPWIPIFGCGFLLLFPLTRYEAHPEVVFIMGAFLSTVLEYATSLIMEKIFRTRWWDYSHMKFNINGRVALRNSLGFGVVGILIVYVFRHVNNAIFDFLPEKALIVMSLGLLALFVIDSIISTKIVLKVARTDELLKKKDMTKEIKTRVRGELKENYILVDKLLNTFPRAFGNVRKVFKTIRRKK